jgi:hypothetical protein
MRNKIRITLIGLFFVMAYSHCNNKTNKVADTVKFQANDPFKTSMTASHFFDIDSKQNNVLEGDNGTIVVCPKGCFKNSKDEIVEGNVKVELSEALSLDEMILSNLTTTSNGKLLETDGMIYFNATLNGQQLTINKANPIHVEIPTKQKKPGMMAYKGIRDEKGNMNWVEPKALENYLIPVDFDLLDFLPEGFQSEVEKGMPYRKYLTATKKLTDSLFYILSVSNGSELINGLVNTNLNEPYYNKQKKIVKGKYTKQSYQVNNAPVDSVQKDTSSNCGIDPAIIKVIKSKKYQNTLIATKEFEARLQVIFKTCNNAVLEIYTKNTGKNLYELDSLAEVEVHETQYYHDFHNFYLQKLTNVKEADKYFELLKGYYDKQLSKIRSDLEEAKEKIVRRLNKKNAEAEKLADNYRNLLWKREKYRMGTYGFNWTETGWINIDTGTIPKTWGPQRLEITIGNSKQFDRVYTYVVYTTIKSLYRLNSDNNELFYVGNNEDKNMLMPKHSMAFGIAIAYKGETSFLAIKQFETGTDEQFTLSPERSTKEKIKESIKSYDKYAAENRISIDLEYMDKFFIEQARQKNLIKESDFIRRLWQIVYKCCSPPTTTLDEVVK